jgi:hypothetical protein
MQKRVIALLPILVLIAGCGSNGPAMVKVRGIVTLDGKPVEDAAVGFAPQNGDRPATGTTDASGHFTLTTFAPGDGAIVGTHTVTVSKIRSSGQQVDASTVPAGSNAMPLSGPTAPGAIKIQWVVPPKYADPKTSGFTVDVKRGMEPVTLELKSK